MVDEIRRADFLAFLIALPMGLAGCSVDCILVLGLEQGVGFGLYVQCNIAARTDQRDIRFVEELVFGREPLHAVRHVPCDGVAVSPVLFKGVPNSSQVLGMLKHNDREVRLLHLGDVRHPEVREILRQRLGAEVHAILLCTEPTRDAVFLLCLSF